MIKSNLRYPGGKSRLIKHLDNYFPSKIDFYLEPFVGGGSVLLHVIQEYNPKRVYANDIDTELINYYQCIQLKQVNLSMRTWLRAMKTNNSAEDFKKNFNDIKETNYTTHHLRAMKYFVLNKCGFNGLRSSTYSKQAYEKNFTTSSINKLEDIGNVIRDVSFFNIDFREMNLNPVKDFFIFLDPPYYENGKKGLYGKDGKYHSKFDHNAFVEFVKLLSKNNKIMITYDNCEWVREQFKDFNQYDFQATYSMTNNNKTGKAKVGKELIITNYEPEKTLF